MIQKTKPQSDDDEQPFMLPQLSFLLPVQCKSPSEQQNNLPLKIQRQIRAFGCRCIQQAGILLRLPQISMLAGQAIFQHFFYQISFFTNSNSICIGILKSTMIASLFVATKLQQTPRKLRDITSVFHYVWMIQESKCGWRNRKNLQVIDRGSVQFQNIIADVVNQERLILALLGYGLHKITGENNPIKYVYPIIENVVQQNDRKNRQFINKCFGYLNDSAQIPLICFYKPEAIAVSIVFLSACQCNIPLPECQWWRVFGVDKFDIEVKQIVGLIKQLYEIEQAGIKVDQIYELGRIMNVNLWNQPINNYYHSGLDYLSKLNLKFLDQVDQQEQEEEEQVICQDKDHQKEQQCIQQQKKQTIKEQDTTKNGNKKQDSSQQSQDQDNKDLMKRLKQVQETQQLAKKNKKKQQQRRKQQRGSPYHEVRKHPTSKKRDYRRDSIERQGYYDRNRSKYQRSNRSSRHHHPHRRYSDEYSDNDRHYHHRSHHHHHSRYEDNRKDKKRYYDDQYQRDKRGSRDRYNKKKRGRSSSSSR